MTALFTRAGSVGSVAYSASGEGPAIVLLHPIGMDRSWWAPYVEHWESRHRVIAIDLAGHGESTPIKDAISLADHARAVLDVIAAEAIAPAVIVGVSMGGMVAQSVAIAAPHQVRGLVLCATAAAFPDAARPAIRERGDTSRIGSMSEVIDATIGRWFTVESPPDLVAKCRARLAADDWYSWSANWEAISALDNLALLSGLRMPALVIAGDRDASIPVPIVKQLADALGADLSVMENSAHFGAFDTPHRFMSLMDRFLATVHAS